MCESHAISNTQAISVCVVPDGTLCGSSGDDAVILHTSTLPRTPIIIMEPRPYACTRAAPLAEFRDSPRAQVGHESRGRHVCHRLHDMLVHLWECTSVIALGFDSI
jgi:hypothetical protein